MYPFHLINTFFLNSFNTHPLQSMCTFKKMYLQSRWTHKFIRFLKVEFTFARYEWNLRTYLHWTSFRRNSIRRQFFLRITRTLYIFIVSFEVFRNEYLRVRMLLFNLPPFISPLLMCTLKRHRPCFGHFLNIFSSNICEKTYKKKQ